MICSGAEVDMWRERLENNIWRKKKIGLGSGFAWKIVLVQINDS